MIVLTGEWLVIGAKSLVGSRFLELTEGNITAVDSEELDVTSEKQVEDVLNKFPGRFVINFAGATIVEEIEKTRPKDPNNQEELEQNLAYRVNVLGTRYIAQTCKRLGKFPIFISSGFVFGGKSGPYSEEDRVASDPNEVSWYAWTKVLAEKEVEISGVENLTIRISYPYRSQHQTKGDFARNFLNLYDSVQKGEKSWYPIFTDQTLTPTFIDDLPQAVKALVEGEVSGIYHVTSPLLTNPYEFCCEVLKVARGVENPESLVPKGSLVEFQNSHPDLPKKPLKGGEKTDKIQALGFTPTNWKEGINKAFG